ncbi:MAG: hypothetical protein M5R36_17195 [Deltaproteobacteria bacterium]|nr:hypothetical protein [Deltaproteobacteria bacterium]
MKSFILAMSLLVLVLGTAGPTLGETPSARTGHAMAALPDGSVLLFGGKDGDGNVLGDTWIFSGAKDGGWDNAAPPNAPEARHGHKMVTLPDGKVMLFGGENINAELQNDLHKFENNGWHPTAPSTASPPGRRDHLAWTDGQKLYVSGGRTASETLSDLWEYDFASNAWTQRADAPHPIAGAAVGSTEYTAYVTGYADDTPIYSYASDAWYDMPYDPNGMALRTMAANTQSNYFAFIFGGFSIVKDGDVLGDAWTFDFTTKEYVQRADLPFPVAGAAAALIGSKAGETMLIFGGELGDGNLSDATLYYDSSADTWEDAGADDDDDDDDGDDDTESPADDDTEADNDNDGGGAGDDDDDGGCGC